MQKLNSLNLSLEWDFSFRVIGSKASLVRYHLKDVAVKARGEPPGHLEGGQPKHGEQQVQSSGAGLHVAWLKGVKLVSSVLGTLIKGPRPLRCKSLALVAPKGRSTHRFTLVLGRVMKPCLSQSLSL